MEDDLKKKWKTPPQKMEDDLKKKEKWKTTSKKMVDDLKKNGRRPQKK